MLRLFQAIAMRLDVYLFERGLADSRTDAKNLIQSGAVSISGVVIKKPAYSIDENDIASVTVDRQMKKYVSRGGFKLEAALGTFDIDISGKLCIDVGASTGGFTDCLLQNGARRVIAIDSGTSQLSPSLKSDARVVSIENYNARYLDKNDLPYVPEIAVMDVSFISATYIIKPVFDALIPNGAFVCLVKPQFEVGRENIGKGGIVKTEKARLNALNKVVDYARSVGFEFRGSIVSPIEGGDGNIEYLAYFIKR